MTILVLLALATLLLLIAGAPFVPTHNHDLSEIFDQLGPADKRVFVDLGSGDGRVLSQAKRRGFRVVGYEINPIFWLVSKFKLGWSENIRLTAWQTADLTTADVIYVFSTSWHLKNLDRQRFGKSSTIVIYGPQPTGWSDVDSTKLGSAVVYWPVAPVE